MQPASAIALATVSECVKCLLLDPHVDQRVVQQIALLVGQIAVPPNQCLPVPHQQPNIDVGGPFRLALSALPDRLAKNKWYTCLVTHVSGDGGVAVAPARPVHVHFTVVAVDTKRGTETDATHTLQAEVNGAITNQDALQVRLRFKQISSGFGGQHVQLCVTCHGWCDQGTAPLPASCSTTVTSRAEGERTGLAACFPKRKFGKEYQERFERAGIVTVEQLAAVPLDDPGLSHLHAQVHEKQGPLTKTILHSAILTARRSLGASDPSQHPTGQRHQPRPCQPPCPPRPPLPSAQCGEQGQGAVGGVWGGPSCVSPVASVPAASSHVPEELGLSLAPGANAACQGGVHNGKAAHTMRPSDALLHHTPPQPPPSPPPSHSPDGDDAQGLQGVSSALLTPPRPPQPEDDDLGSAWFAESFVGDGELLVDTPGCAALGFDASVVADGLFATDQGFFS